MSLKAVPSPGQHPPAPPADLGATGKDLWLRLTTDYNISDQHGLAVLTVAARAADRAESCRLAVGKSLLVRDKWRQVKPNPLLAVERAARAQLLQALRQLQLPIPED